MKKINNKLSNNRGYTLLEVMATVAILSLLVSLVNASLITMERNEVAQSVDSSVDTLYFNAQDLMVKARANGDFEAATTTSSGLWRGFNPLDPRLVVTGTLSGFDVAYMVEYPDYTWEDPSNLIDYTTMGVDVDEGYQLPFLKDLIAPEEGFIQAYGILFELHTGTILETNVVKIPYDTGSDYTTAKAKAAAKIASSIVGTAVRDLYQNYIAADCSNLPVFIVPASTAVNGYGDSHLFNRDNMFSSVSSTMYQRRLDYYCDWCVDNIAYNGGIYRLDDYLGLYGLDIDTVLSFTGLDI